MEIAVDYLQKLIASLPGWAFDRLYNMGFPTAGLPFKVKANEVVFGGNDAPKMRLLSNGTLMIGEKEVDEEDFIKYGRLLANTSAEFARMFVERLDLKDYEILPTGSIKCRWFITRIDEKYPLFFSMGNFDGHTIRCGCPDDDLSYENMIAGTDTFGRTKYYMVLGDVINASYMSSFGARFFTLKTDGCLVYSEPKMDAINGLDEAYDYLSNELSRIKKRGKNSRA